MAGKYSVEGWNSGFFSPLTGEPIEYRRAQFAHTFLMAKFLFFLAKHTYDNAAIYKNGEVIREFPRNQQKEGDR